MKSASTLFSEQDREAVAAAVADAERGTAGEIVPVVATISGRYDRAEDLFGLMLGLIALVVVWTLFQGTAEADWAAGHVPTLGLFTVVLVVAVGFVGGASLATRIPLLRLPFIPRSEMHEEVQRRALEAFQRHRVRATTGATGVLIYVSLYERMVRVVGDDAIAARVTQQDWEAICELVVDGMRAGRPAHGLEEGVRKAGELLAGHFPIEPGNRNELSNALTLID
jgi:putative membrane protein